MGALKPEFDGRAVSRERRIDIVNSTIRQIGPDGRNMYGCTACPNCGSGCRFATRDVHPIEPMRIACDECGRSKRYVRHGDYFDEAK